MIHPRHAPVWCPGFLGLGVRWTQGNVSFLSPHMYPSGTVPTLAFATNSKLRKRRLQETDHPFDITYSKVRMFKPNSHEPLPSALGGLRRASTDCGAAQLNNSTHAGL